MNIRDFSEVRLRRSLTCFQKKRKASPFVSKKSEPMILRKNLGAQNLPFALKGILVWQQSVDNMLLKMGVSLDG